MLDKTGLKKGIIDLLTDMESRNEDSKDEFARRLGDVIEAFVRSGTVIVEAGIPVSTTGTAAVQTGATTGSGVGSIS